MSAVPADPPDEAVAGHYGDPYREQRHPGPVDLSHRPVVRVTGPDRLTWLHSLTSQHLLDLAPGGLTEALVLSPQGHVEHHLQIVDDGQQLLAHVEPGTADALVAFLDRMRFLLRVEVSDASDEWAVVWDAEPGREGLAQVTGFGQHTFLPRTALPACTSGLLAYEALRVEARRPRLGLDTDGKTLPHEVGWLVGAVHLDKGCYRGQETVARVHNLGRPPRRLALLHLDGSDSELPTAGDDVLLDGRAVGRVGTAVRHHELGPLALALVKRQVPVDAALVDGGIPAAVDPDPGPAVPVSAAREAAAARSGLLRMPRGT